MNGAKEKRGFSKPIMKPGDVVLERRSCAAESISQ